MNETVLIALITLGGSGLGSLVGIILSSKLTAYRLEQLEKKVDKHNGVIERVYRLEEKASIHEEKISVVNHRIDDLERVG